MTFMKQMNTIPEVTVAELIFFSLTPSTMRETLIGMMGFLAGACLVGGVGEAGGVGGARDSACFERRVTTMVG